MDQGLNNANKFIIGAATSYNLKKWLNYTEQNRKMAAISLKKTAETLCLWLSAVRCFIHRHHTKSTNHFIAY